MSETEKSVAKVPVLLEHHEGDERMTATVPLIEGCLAEGETRDQAKEAIVPEVQYFVKRDPQLRDVLKNPPKFELTEVEVPLNETPPATEQSKK